MEYIFPRKIWATLTHTEWPFDSLFRKVSSGFIFIINKKTTIVWLETFKNIFIFPAHHNNVMCIFPIAIHMDHYHFLTYIIFKTWKENEIEIYDNNEPTYLTMSLIDTSKVIKASWNENWIDIHKRYIYIYNILYI